ncbi:MAG: mannose-1-phosphate guanylyltransferase [Candidatus Omnitrophica bacterium]|nr:mannose-1-phosphate guanylyltransferase [Candidatus Omnitrophota bacterium]
MNWALIMAGGAGTRFWPASRLARPKQLLPILKSRSLIQETVSRISLLIPPSRMIILTQAKQIDLIRKALPQIPKRNFIVEPVGRNTAPALALGALVVNHRDPKAVIFCAPADQLVIDAKKFLRAVRAGIETAKNGGVHVTFGIPPTAPETGFGYIERGTATFKKSGLSVYEVKRFVEKPKLNRARQFLKSGKFFWNSGIFIWNAAWFLSELEKAQPALLQQLKKAVVSHQALRKIYPTLENISIDYALMESAKNVCMIPGDFGWSDLGTWSAFDKIWPKDSLQNASRNRLVSVDSSGNIVDGDSKLVALLGVNDLVVVSTPDAILVARKDRVQDVREIIDILKHQRLEQYL